MKIVQATKRDWQLIAGVADRSWRIGYAGVLSDVQIDFMLNRSYTERGIAEAMDGGQIFYLGNDGEKTVGFAAVQRQGADVLRLEKLYLSPEEQGKGYGGNFILFAERLALQLGFSLLELNVNRNNKAYHFYLRQGFEIWKTVDIPYFGFVLNDYVMRKRVTGTMAQPTHSSLDK